MSPSPERSKKTWGTRGFAAELVSGADEMGVGGFAEMDHEIDMIACGDRLDRVAPFSHENGLGIVAVEPRAEALPETCEGVGVLAAADERRGHVHAEAIAAEVEPELHDGAQLGAHRKAGWMLRRELPGLRRIGLVIAVAKRGLERQEIGHEVFAVGGARHGLPKHATSAVRHR